MKSAETLFLEDMLDPDFSKWYYSRPETVKALARRFPYKKYRMRSDAPYAITAPGSTVYLQSYRNDGHVTVTIRTVDMTPAIIEHIKSLPNGPYHLEMQMKTPENSGTTAVIHPKYLIPIE